MKTYRETLTPRTKDCDFKGEWRLSAILESLQEAAGGHCNRLGCGRSTLRKKGIARVLLRNELRMVRYLAGTCEGKVAFEIGCRMRTAEVE